jgi:hypothetical protein
MILMEIAKEVVEDSMELHTSRAESKRERDSTTYSQTSLIPV